MDEREIVDRARGGNAEAIGELYDLYLTPIYRFVLGRVASASEAEDITEEVFLRVIEYIGRFEWLDVPFSAWLYRIAHNQVISHHRKKGGRPTNVSTEFIDVEDHQPGPESLAEQSLTMREVFEACKRLPRSATGDRAPLRLRALRARNGDHPGQDREQRQGAPAQGNREAPEAAQVAAHVAPRQGRAGLPVPTFPLMPKTAFNPAIRRRSRRASVADASQRGQAHPFTPVRGVRSACVLVLRTDQNEPAGGRQCHGICQINDDG